MQFNLKQNIDITQSSKTQINQKQALNKPFTKQKCIIVIDWQNTKKKSEFNLNKFCRIYDHKQGKVIEGKFLDNKCINAKVWYRFSKLQNAEVDENFQIQGNNVKQYNMNDILIYEGSYKRNKRNGIGKQYIYNENTATLKITIEGYYCQGVKEGQFYSIIANKQTYALYNYHNNNICIDKMFINVKDQKIIKREQIQDNLKQTSYSLNKEDILKQNQLLLQRIKQYWKTKENQTFLNNQNQNYKKYFIHKESLNKILQKGQQLSDQMCNAFANAMFRTQKNVDTFIFQQWFARSLFKNQQLTEQTYQRSIQHTILLAHDDNIFNGIWKSILFPFIYHSQKGNHFALVQLNIKIDTIEINYYDSMDIKITRSKYEQTYKKIHRNLLSFLYNYLKDQKRTYFEMRNNQELHKKIQNAKFINMEVPKQKDGYSCGIFVCFFIECIVKNNNLMEQNFNPLQYRQKIRNQIEKVLS